MDYFDLDALNTVLEYNKEDVVNLKVLKERLLGLLTKTSSLFKVATTFRTHNYSSFSDLAITENYFLGKAN